jgi:branched-chain amino acid transport system permease protein
MDYLIHLAILVSIYSILSLSLNVIAGYAGLISMATSAFMGMGAYFVAIMLTKFDLNFFLALGLAMIIVGIIAFFVDLVFSRLRGDYFTLGSMGIVVITSGIFINWQPVTNGPAGIANIPRPNLFGFELSENWQFLCLSIFILILTYLVCEWIVNLYFSRTPILDLA